MRKVFTILLILFVTGTSYGQMPKRISKKMGMFPIVFLDSLEINSSELKSLNPLEISNVTILSRKRAKKNLGDKGSDGAIYVTTKKVARVRNWAFLKSKSDEYSKLVSSPNADTILQYVLNGKLLPDSSTIGSLFLVNEKNFRSLTIIDTQVEKTKYLTSKRIIVKVSAKRPNKGLLKKSDFD